jgi:Putative intracellular protease/amidase
MEILFVLTSNDKMGNTQHKTGFWLEEFTTPYYIFKDAGAMITLASPEGGHPPIDPKSKDPEFQTESTKRFNADMASKVMLANTYKLSYINPERYDAVFYPGGHGPLWDLVDNKNSIAIIENLFNAGKLVGAICHSPCIFHHTRAANGEPLVKGKRITALSNTEEESVQLTKIVPFLVEDMLKENGAEYSKEQNWLPYMQNDGNLITGQNPASSALVANEILKLLKTRM